MNHNVSCPRLTQCIVLAFSVVMIAQQLWSQEPHVVSMNDGYLFIDGQYVHPPYDIQLTDDRLTINDQAFAEDYFDLSYFEREFSDGPGRMDRRIGTMQRGPRDRGGRRPFSPLEWIARQLEPVALGAIVALYEQEKPLLLYPDRGGHLLISELAGRADTEFEAPTNIAPQDQVTWNRLVSEFEPTTLFLARANANIQAVEEATLTGDRTSAANQLVAQISYPLTMFAMIVVVVGFGHLLSNRPVHDPVSGDATKSQQVILKSLSIVALLSILDLVLTIAATNAGTMRELNPLGSQFIDNPMRLVFFKLTVTGTSIGLLYLLRRKPVAQIASWWCCLLLTLLTARWVVFQSMFL